MPVPVSHGEKVAQRTIFTREEAGFIGLPVPSTAQNSPCASLLAGLVSTSAASAPQLPQHSRSSTLPVQRPGSPFRVLRNLRDPHAKQSTWTQYTRR